MAASLYSSRSQAIARFHGDCPQGDETYSNGAYHPGHSKCIKRRRQLEANLRQAAFNARYAALQEQQQLVALVAKSTTEHSRPRSRKRKRR